MPLLKDLQFNRFGFVLKKKNKCINCGKEILGGGNNLYSKRFCSDECMLNYLR